MKFSASFPHLPLRLFLFAVVPCLCAGRVHAQANLNYKGEIEFAFVNKFTKVWDDEGTHCAKVSFWQPTVPAGYVKVGDFGHLGRHVPSDKEVVVVVKALKEGALAHPTDFTLIWWDAKNKCFFWRPMPPKGFVAMGTVIAPDGRKPGKEAVACIRQDLVVAGTVGARIWDDHGSKAYWDTSIYPTGTTIPPQGVAYFTPNTFLSFTTYVPAKTHPCAYQFQIAVPAQQAHEMIPAIPTLKNFEKPGQYAAETVKQSCLLPWFAVNDNALSTADKLAKSPYYKLERTDRYKLVFHTYNKSDVERTEKVSYKVGFAKANLNHWLATTAIEVSGGYKLGNPAKGEARRSIRISPNLAFGGKNLISTDEVTRERSITVQPGTAAAAYVIESTYRLYRDSGKGPEVYTDPQDMLCAGVQPGSLHIAAYPPPVREQLGATDNPLHGVVRYLALKGNGSYTKSGSKWVVIGPSGAGTTVFAETGRDKEWITILDARRSLTVRLPVGDGMCFSSVDGGKSWSENGAVKLAR